MGGAEGAVECGRPETGGGQEEGEEGRGGREGEEEGGEGEGGGGEEVVG